MTMFESWPSTERRCNKNGSLLCTAHTDPYLDLDHKYHHTIFSRDPGENPAFWDFSIGEQENSDQQDTSASKSSIRRFVITDKAPTRAFSWLKAATTAFTFKTLLRHYAEWALTPQSVNVIMGPPMQLS